MNSNERKTLLGRVATDPAFRRQLLKDPKKAAATLRIKLTAAQAAAIIATSNKIAMNCADFDERREAKPCLIPIIKVV